MIVVNVCKWFLFTVAVIYLFFNKYWLWEAELFIVQAVFAITVVFFEIPTWFIADKYWRKRSISIWLFISAVGFLMYYLWSWFRWFLIAEFLLAIGSCCKSWSDTSLIYDSLHQQGKTDDFKKASWLLSSISNWSEWIGWIVGWFIGMYSLEFPFLLDSAVVFIGFLVSLTIQEPSYHKFDHTESNIKQLTSVLRYAYTNKKIFWLIMFSWFMWALTLSMVWFSQPFLTKNGVWPQYIWIYRVVSNLAVGYFWLVAHKLESFRWSKQFTLVLILLSFVSTVGIGIYPHLIMLPLFLIFQFVRGGSRIIVNDELHVQSASKMRATIQSIRSMFFRLCFAVFWPIAWRLSAKYWLGIAIMSLSIVLCSICLFVRRKYYFTLVIDTSNAENENTEYT